MAVVIRVVEDAGQVFVAAPCGCAWTARTHQAEVVGESVTQAVDHVREKRACFDPFENLMILARVSKSSETPRH